MRRFVYPGTYLPALCLCPYLPLSLLFARPCKRRILFFLNNQNRVGLLFTVRYARVVVMLVCSSYGCSSDHLYLPTYLPTCRYLLSSSTRTIWIFDMLASCSRRRVLGGDNHAVTLHEDVYHRQTSLPVFRRAFPRLYETKNENRIEELESTLVELLQAIRAVCRREEGALYNAWSTDACFSTACMVADRSSVSSSRQPRFRWSGPSAGSRCRVGSTTGRWKAFQSQYLQVRLKPGIWEYAHRIQLWCTKGMPRWTGNDARDGGPGGRHGVPVTLHFCQRPSCQQPHHLTWGTTQDNLFGPTRRNGIISKRVTTRNKNRAVEAARRRLRQEQN